ncbi:calcium-activated potassium channel subunit beta-4-like [Scomber scombrus]|uniref:calcium-activated potassium channel subunit beta-4-like n=1 Tax=Scomber scombrus TaxID=13677 RepID=UPI002DDBA7FD|nr:calcium-activated potassium channel subunit beta-4-like [Scomber scombrus]
MAKIRVSYEYSEAEDKSIRLGLFLIACGILSLFILGFCWLSPTLQSLQSKPANCTVVSVLRPEEMFECVFTCGADCKGTSLYPCLQIFVNNSESNSVALLHFDEQQLVLNPKLSEVMSRTEIDRVRMNQ